MFPQVSPARSVGVMGLEEQGQEHLGPEAATPIPEHVNWCLPCPTAFGQHLRSVGQEPGRGHPFFTAAFFEICPKHTEWPWDTYLLRRPCKARRGTVCRGLRYN